MIAERRALAEAARVLAATAEDVARDARAVMTGYTALREAADAYARAEIARRRAAHPDATAPLDMTAEGYVREFVKRGRPKSRPLEVWEQRYQDAGLIQAAADAGLIHIGRDVACTITLTWEGEALVSFG